MMEAIQEMAPMITTEELMSAMLLAHTTMSTTFGHDEKMAAAATVLSTFAGEELTAEDIEHEYAYLLGQYSTCEECNSGYNFDIYDQCQACPSGQYDRNALAGTAPRCTPCPEGCEKCSLGGDGDLHCLECMEDWF